ncbi:cation:proton antiporter [Pseudonocardia halophobica]|uniref:Sodium:proton antiporter n=1 Tax=Pseudonocardia halophobica TaxID=29401 RepID=A0A9W6KWG5_9PSEU|nr:cation:proton antiporter [Pseudonocardia halophobica]GLL09347.1 sodium:proton antiporter [Pseudonocardia halophobica]
MQFVNLLIVVTVAFAAPLVVRLFPALRLPSPVLEILIGVVLGPSVLGWVQIDQPVEVLALIGLAFLLFLAGLEIDVHRLRGRSLRLALIGFAVSFVLAAGVGFALAGSGLTRAPLLVAIVLCATSLGLVVPVLKDAGQIMNQAGQLVIAAASIADFGAVILLSLFFSGSSTPAGLKVLLLGGLAVVAAVAVLALMRVERSTRRLVAMLADTTAQIRVRFAVLMLVAFVALAAGLGFEAILGAFLAGAVLRLVDPAAAVTHPQTAVKLDAIGYGFLVPVFFVASGIQFDAAALFGSTAAVVQVPLFVVALLLVRGLPALLYRRSMGTRQTLAAAFLQATSLPFIVAAVAIGQRLGVLSPATGAALVAAGLVSVLVFPAAALAVLRGARTTTTSTKEPDPSEAGRA